MSNVKKIAGFPGWLSLIIAFGWVAVLVKNGHDEAKEAGAVSNYRAALWEAGPLKACPACAGLGMVTTVASGAVPTDAQRTCSQCQGTGIVSAMRE